ncbi:uncharacterized protein LOC115625635 [Scaptodrosophila lebanonensis]|uniref:Uncharacterized protein LOC115621937 n=1 Tax=Drosophila lebanonensis TaxID=7225 RepID=A0A6J2TKS5_DROLE|nr:uncharacterized protein LOC115621937 [Scaptodrosophila lebanonensis]XP_030376624.1 uncharacterized protein LOC115625635 [Scaptodrosophila lebanonensis]
MNTECKHPTDMWGDPNPNIFYVCNAADQTPLQLHCPEGRGFFDGLGFKGCLPYAHWPACRPTAAQAAALLEVGCDSPNRSPSSSADNDGVDDDDAHLQQPWATLDPNKFYMCPGIAATPLLLNCAGGKGFVQTSDIVGCADWLLWRQHMQCEKYY